MLLGPALSACSAQRVAADPVFDPTTEALSGLFRDYPGAASLPWAGEETGGDSSSREFDAGSATAGTAVNGHAPAAFDGTQALFSSDNGDLYISTTGYRVVLLARTNSGPAPSGNAYSDPSILASPSGNWGIAWASNGVTVYHYDGAYKTATAAASTDNTWHSIDISYDGVADVLSITVDDGTPVTTSGVGTLGSIAFDLYMGVGYDGSSYRFTGQVLDMAFATSALADVTSADWLAYHRDRYGVPL